MYRTKKDVDRHVQDINNKIKNPTERSLKGYSVAKLYFQVNANMSRYFAYTFVIVFWPSEFAYTGFGLLQAVYRIRSFFEKDPDPRIRTTGLRIRILLLSLVTIKIPT